MTTRPTQRPHLVVLLAAILGSATLLAALAAPGIDRAYGASPQDRGKFTDKFIGTWALEDDFLQDPSGAVLGSLYQDGTGKLTYTQRGDFWAHVGERAGTANEIWYTGTFDVIRKTHQVIHHVEYASAPGWEGGDQVRRFTFDGKQRLTLAAENPSLTTVFEWRRVRGG